MKRLRRPLETREQLSEIDSGDTNGSRIEEANRRQNVCWTERIVQRDNKHLSMMGSADLIKTLSKMGGNSSPTRHISDNPLILNNLVSDVSVYQSYHRGNPQA